MLTDRLIALICLTGFFAFMLVSVVYIKEFDLAVVVVLTLALVSFDFWRALFRSNAGKNGGDS